MTEVERDLINEIIKLFIANQWVLTPEGIWGFLQTHGNPMHLNEVLAIYQEITQEGIER